MTGGETSVWYELLTAVLATGLVVWVFRRVNRR